MNIIHTFTPDLSISPPQVWTVAGGAAADFDLDGFPDIFLLGGGNEKDRLYINQQDGTFLNTSSDWGLTQMHSGVGAAAADFDSDGRIDIYVTSNGNVGDAGPAPGQNKLFRNNLNGTFTNVAESAGVAWTCDFPASYGAAWGDYNLDGHLDLHVACWWVQPNVQSSVLFRNNGDGTFTNVTVEAGVFDNTVYGYQGIFADMDNNGWPDLLLAADFRTSRYYRNNGDGTFTNITKQSGTGLDFNGMGLAVADINNNGLLDWYVTSIYPLFSQPGNMLYINQGDHTYIEIAGPAGVEDGGWGWGALAVDLDHKGWVDLIEVNGRQSTPYHNVPPRLFYNNGDETFTDIAVESGMFHPEQGRGLLRLDADRDGRQELVIMNFAQPARYYYNATEGVGNWIVFELDTSSNPLLAPNGFGTRVIIEADGQSFMRYLHGEPSYLATSELNLHFGLGDAAVIDSITIHWPRGYVTTLEGVAINQYLHITAPALADLNADGVVNVFDLLQLLAMWGPVSDALDLHADVNNDGQVNVFDLLILLANWG